MKDKRIYRSDKTARLSNGLDYKRLGARAREERERAGINSVKSMVALMEESTGFVTSTDSVYRFEKGARFDYSLLVSFCLTLAGDHWYIFLRNLTHDCMPEGFEMAACDDGPSRLEVSKMQFLLGGYANVRLGDFADIDIPPEEED